MARGSSKGSSANAIVSLGLFAVAAILVALATAGFYLYPILCLGVLLFTPTSPRPPLPEDVSGLDDSDEHTRVAEMLVTFRKMLAIKERVIEDADAKGLSTTKGSNYTRYDARKKEGREANDNLDLLESRIQNLASEISLVRTATFEIISQQWALVDRWVSLRALRFGMFVSIAVASACFGFYTLVYGPVPGRTGFIPRLSEGATNLILWRPDTPITLLAAAAFAVICGYVTLAIVYFAIRPQVMASLSDPYVNELARLVNKWHPDANINVFSEVNCSTADEDLQTAPESFVDQQIEEWWDVLGIPAHSSVEEIKSAYRKAMLEYHSDRVAHLGEKLRALAEQETLRLNSAYEAAKSAKGIA